MKIIMLSLFLAMMFIGVSAVSQNKKSASVLLKSGKEKASNKDYYGAIEDYTQAIELSPSFAKAYYARGVAYLKYNKKSKSRSEVYKQKARADLMKAKELGLAVPQNILDECE